MNQISSLNNVQFKGISLRSVSTRRRLCQLDTAEMLAQNPKDIIQLTKHASSKRMAFWESLARNYNRNNYYRSYGEKENSKIVNNVFSLVKRPKDIHRYIVHNFADSFQNIERIFKGAQNKKSHLEFVRRVNSDIFANGREKGNDLIPQLLESPLCNEYIKNYKDIRAYLMLHKNDPEAVKRLDSMYKTGSFDNIYDEAYQKQEIKKSWCYPNTEILNAETFCENYSDSSAQIFSSLDGHMLISDDIIKTGGDKYILDILKTTNENNLDLRQTILENLGSGTLLNKSNNENIEALKEFAKLFNTVDNNTDANNFITSFCENLSFDISAKEINDILANIPANKLEIFQKNAKRIIARTRGQERINALKNELTNPFFETRESRHNKRLSIKYGYTKKDSFLTNTIKRIENYYNILKYSFLKNPETELAANVPDIQPVSPAPVVVNKVAEIQPPKVKNDKTIVKENVLSVVAKKLTPKTLDKQKTLYEKNATKMRLSMLPEIFSSVAETRKIDRAAGKRKNLSSNKDVLDLYTKINGNNKKFVNYLLKKRNTDGNRLFTVKDIIAMLDKAEAKIVANKQANPDYRARDARRYYNHLYEAKIQQYGKLQRTRTK